MSIAPPLARGTEPEPTLLRRRCGPARRPRLAARGPAAPLDEGCSPQPRHRAHSPPRTTSTPRQETEEVLADYEDVEEEDKGAAGEEGGSAGGK